jgi:hypothetical protein
MVKVFIEDQRCAPSQKSVEVMKLGVIKGGHAGTGKWCVHANELWRALQDSLVHILGKST